VTRERFLAAAIVLAFFLAWEAAVRALAIPSFILPAPSVTFAAFGKWGGPILEHSFQTFYTTVVGFAMAMAAGMALGVALGATALLYKSLYPLLVGFNTVPKVALVPLLVMWFGIGSVPAIITAFLIAFFPIVVNVATGIATVEPELQDVLRSLGAKKIDVLRKIGIPRSLPYFFASLKISITFAFVGSIVSETVAANSGIGHLMTVASGRFEVDLAFAALLVIAAMGVFMYGVTAYFERRMTGWSIRGMEMSVGG
jgi:NitT/TauT family transport system permease protein